MHSLVEMFFDVDDFCQEFLRQCEQRNLTAGIVRVSPIRADNFIWFLYDFNKGVNGSIRERIRLY
jgi:hypothetical protein